MVSHIFWVVALSVVVSFILGFLTYNLVERSAPSQKEKKPDSTSTSA